MGDAVDACGFDSLGVSVHLVEDTVVASEVDAAGHTGRRTEGGNVFVAYDVEITPTASGFIFVDVCGVNLNSDIHAWNEYAFSHDRRSVALSNDGLNAGVGEAVGFKDADASGKGKFCQTGTAVESVLLNYGSR